jgi:hypothetical protein
VEEEVMSISPVVPTGNGDERGMEEGLSDPGTPLPSRTERSNANDARYGDQGADVGADPKAQGGFGSEDMKADSQITGPAERPQDILAPPPNLAALGDGGQTFGGGS